MLYWRDFFFFKVDLLLFGQLSRQRNLQKALTATGIESCHALFLSLTDEVRFNPMIATEICVAPTMLVTLPMTLLRHPRLQK